MTRTKKNKFAARKSEFGGEVFRSHLEAEWARFYSRVGTAWQYEPKSFNTRHGPYVPDFHLTEQGIWVEVKPVNPSVIEAEKGEDVQKQIGQEEFMFAVGLPPLSNRRRNTSYDNIDPKEQFKRE